MRELTEEQATYPTNYHMNSDGIATPVEAVLIRKPKRAGAPFGNSNSVSHGFYRRKIRLDSVSFDDVSLKSEGGLQLHNRRNELRAFAGPNRGPVIDALIDRICIQENLAMHLDLYAVQLGPKILNRRKRTAAPFLNMRQNLINSLITMYDKLGYKPTPTPTPSFADYVESKTAQPTPKPSKLAKSRPGASSQEFQLLQAEPLASEFDDNDNGPLDRTFPTGVGSSEGLTPLPKTFTPTAEPQESRLSKVSEPDQPKPEISGEKVFRCTRCHTPVVFPVTAKKRFCPRCQGYARFEADETTTPREIREMERADAEKRRKQEASEYE